MTYWSDCVWQMGRNNPVGCFDVLDTYYELERTKLRAKELLPQVLELYPLTTLGPIKRVDQPRLRVLHPIQTIVKTNRGF